MTCPSQLPWQPLIANYGKRQANEIYAHFPTNSPDNLNLQAKVTVHPPPVEPVETGGG